MIKLTEKYYIDFDSLNIMLKEKYVSKKTGKDFFENLGFFITFEDLADYLVSKCYMKQDSSELKSLVDIKDSIDDFKREISNKIKLLAKDDDDFKKCHHSKRKENQI